MSVDGPSCGYEPADGPGEQSDCRATDDADGPVGTDVEPVACHEDGEHQSEDPLWPPHPGPERGNRSDNHRGVCRWVGVAERVCWVVMHVQAGNHRQRTRLPRHPLHALRGELAERESDDQGAEEFESGGSPGSGEQDQAQEQNRHHD